MSTQRQYELVYIMPAEASEKDLADMHAQVAGTVERFSGAIERTEPWGRRKLAYEIGPHKEGVYVLELINGPGELVKELDRRLKVSDRIIRHLVVRVDEEMRVAERQRAARQANTARRRTARGLPAEIERPRPAEGMAEHAPAAGASAPQPQGQPPVPGQAQAPAESETKAEGASPLPVEGRS